MEVLMCRGGVGADVQMCRGAEVQRCRGGDVQITEVYQGQRCRGANMMEVLMC